ncbi:restriction endonuclease subunit S [Acinetobacter oleivorans]|uniref:restriction endonuclease subunit S n=1 Tax=Acinetobacter oleivorans TaxID=1148157 RepID=UPI003A893E4A
MKSHYKKIGDYVRQVNNRNTDLAITNLKGINIDKEFMPSVANVNGTDLSKYKIVEKGQFAFNPMHVGRDEVLPISLWHNDEAIIVSPAYVVFEVIDSSLLDPEYLMIWCKRTEFDRNCWFTTDSSVRGGFSWEDFCTLEIPNISIVEQERLVNEYNSINKRIELSNELLDKIEDKAQTIFKQWFIDFEFPISETYAKSINDIQIVKMPYKTSGGDIEIDPNSGLEIPKGWQILSFEDALNFQTGKLNSNAAIENGKYPFFTCSSETYKTDTYSFDIEAVLLAGNNASAIYPLKYYSGKFDAYQRTYVVTSANKNISIPQIYFAIKYELNGFKGTSSGTATKFLTMKILNDLSIVCPNDEEAIRFNNLVKPLFVYMLNIQKSLLALLTVKKLLLQKMSLVENE